MNAIDYRTVLITRLLEQSAGLDRLAVRVNSQLCPDAVDSRLLAAMRIRLQRTTARLQTLLPASADAWENIGDGG